VYWVLHPQMYRPVDARPGIPPGILASSAINFDGVLFAVAQERVEVDRDLLDSTLEYIRPALQYDGGDMILEGVDEDGTVNLNLVGACSGCPMSMMTLTAGIERILMDRVPGVTAVNAV